MKRVEEKQPSGGKKGGRVEPKPMLASARWVSRPSHPRLVSFNWLGLRPSATER